jgi:hypothetical protein
MEKKNIQVGVLKAIPSGEKPTGKQAKTSKTPPAESEVGGRHAQRELVECPNGHVFYVVDDSDVWEICECPYDGILFRV